MFIVAVNCGQAGGTCFCVSMKTGPEATFGFDLALTEVLNAEQHYFVVEVGTLLVQSFSRTSLTSQRPLRRDRPLEPLWHRPPPRWGVPSIPPTSNPCCTATTSIRAGMRWRRLPDMRQLYDGMSNLLLYYYRRCH